MTGGFGDPASLGQAGAAGVFEKPLDFPLVIRLIGDAVAGRRPGGEPRPGQPGERDPRDDAGA